MPRAGLDAATVTRAGAALADEVGFGQLNMGLLARRLGVKTPSLYKHVASQADLVHRIAVLAALELGDALREATAGLAGRDALVAAAQAMRGYVKQHPGRYAAGNGQAPTGPQDPLAEAVTRLLDILGAALRGYHLAPADEIHALRALRSAFHGFATLELDGGFRLDADLEDSFAWMVDRLDEGLRSVRRRSLRAGHALPG